MTSTFAPARTTATPRPRSPLSRSLSLSLVAALALTCGLSTALTGCATASAPASAAAPAGSRVAPAPSAPDSSLEELARARAAAVQAAVDAADRSPEDRALDAGRHPRALLDFAGVKPGDKVAELMAGGGYTAELLARVVGPAGRVYGQNSPFILQRFAEKPWTERLAKPVMAHTVRLDRELSAPLPAEAQGLDAVFLVLFYHDTVWQKLDRTSMNAAIFRALRPGGAFIVVDHSARPGTGLNDVETLHRIEEDLVKKEILTAGFRLDAEGDFLRNPADTRDWSASPRVAGEKRGTSDRFVLRFVRP